MKVQHCWQKNLWKGFHMDTWAFPLGTVAKGGKSTYLFWNQPIFQAKHLKNHPAFQKLNLACTTNSTAVDHFGKITVDPSFLCSLLLETLRKKEKFKLVLSPRLLPNQEHSGGWSGLPWVPGSSSGRHSSL